MNTRQFTILSIMEKYFDQTLGQECYLFRCESQDSMPIEIVVRKSIAYNSAIWPEFQEGGILEFKFSDSFALSMRYNDVLIFHRTLQEAITENTLLYGDNDDNARNS